MIELFEQNERKADRQSSKGNQLKWENDGIWYKADCTGYEGLAEYMVSHLLEKSSLEKNEFVQYDYEQIKYKSVFYNGVKSRNFLYDYWQIITLERLFQNFFQKSLYEAVWHIQSSVKERFEFLVTQVERITGLKDFEIIPILSRQIPLKMFRQVSNDQNQAETNQCSGTFRYKLVQDIVSNNTKNTSRSVNMLLKHIRNVAGQQITQDSTTYTCDQSHKCEQQKLICMQETDGCFHTEDGESSQSEGIGQKQKVVIHDIRAACDFFGNGISGVEFPTDENYKRCNR